MSNFRWWSPVYLRGLDTSHATTRFTTWAHIYPGVRAAAAQSHKSATTCSSSGQRKYCSTFSPNSLFAKIHCLKISNSTINVYDIKKIAVDTFDPYILLSFNLVRAKRKINHTVLVNKSDSGLKISKHIFYYQNNLLFILQYRFMQLKKYFHILPNMSTRRQHLFTV